MLLFEIQNFLKKIYGKFFQLLSNPKKNTEQIFFFFFVGKFPKKVIKKKF